MKLSKKLNFFMSLILGGLVITSCSDDDNFNTPPVDNNNITAIAYKTENLSILAQALTKTNLDGTLRAKGSYTVFAPTNTAFTTFLNANGFANLDAVPTPVLKEILLNHVVSGALQSSSLTTGYVKTLAKGNASSTNTLSMFINTSSGVRLNGVASVTTANVLATNGVIHVVDAVIGLPTIVTHATANPNFSTLVETLTSAGQPDFVSILSGTGPFTVFAPTNTAFSNLNTELAPGGIAGVSSSNLTKVLQYHVVSPANVLSSTLTNNLSVTTILDQNFTVNLNPARITDVNARVSNITAVDVQCSNGVIHVLDKVLLPNF
ncbi:Uncaracterized surface protein containing fasciclin (FAS1) repeats [Flavobacterium terrae]|uniref:Uncaracterized surface protein containing fasciclin (FAS1) repeats n=2 Tax=Flavobacterium terrae TaxID=415425 RepID=A0A1M6GK36_9FLAO|nr:Uncaracterized surface protein containing fasciclin (FAS1) repeats [Flavobacterium terrae]